ncbi:MAG: hypothetical protein N3D84_03010 [Candidatus Woesearchaeota archaeon]|nr:hypothetical protein [Candidatus Woesearchaeota archaeon]
MALKIPDSMEECVYFTNRTLENNGKAMAWAYRIKCPKCGKAKMGKPVEKGKVKIRAKEYVCPACGFTESKEEHEKKLKLEIIYACPYCGNKGEATTEYKRKMFDGVPAYVFACEKCGKKIGITKKMKKGKSTAEEDINEDI